VEPRVASALLKRPCQHPKCGENIPKERAKNANSKYCSPAHRQAANDLKTKARKRTKETVRKLKDAPLDTSARRGQVYDDLVARPDLLSKYESKDLTETDIAIELGYERSGISRALTQIALDEATMTERAKWPGPSPEAIKSLDDFKTFRDRYFLTEKGEMFTTEGYHQRWIDALLECMETGERLMILSPPRHGKTQLLIHFCVWQIVKNPHIRIAWIAGNKDLAQDWIASIQFELESNDTLIKDFLPHGASFRPAAKSRKSWSRTQFSVATQIFNVKSPTMVAVSRGSKVLSRDVDLIIADDIEDHGSTIQPSNREQTRNWWVTDVLSRKEDHTGWFVIGSRQHPDDLYGHLLESPAWESIVETAHDESVCIGVDEVDIKAHVDCMLWPDRHSYEWLMDQLAASELSGGRALWEMVYLNRPSAEGLTIFSRDQLHASRNPNRDILEYPDDAVLVAGLDPSAVGYQASFCWGYVPSERRLLMIDIENEEGGGIQKARTQIAHWFDQHPEKRLYCRQWYVEDNLYQGAIKKDELLEKYCRDNMIKLDTVHTDRTNKWDPTMGITSMPAWWEAELVDLPYKTPRAKAKTDSYIRQLLNFAAQTTGRNRRANGDQVMASWFPFQHLRFLDDNRTSTMGLTYRPSYPSMTRGSMFNYRRT